MVVTDKVPDKCVRPVPQAMCERRDRFDPAEEECVGGTFFAHPEVVTDRFSARSGQRWRRG
jgi:hypothetical protein